MMKRVDPKEQVPLTPEQIIENQKLQIQRYESQLEGINNAKSVQLYSVSVLLGKHVVSPLIEHARDSFNEVNQNVTLINRYEAELPKLGQSSLVSTTFYGLKALGVENNLFVSLGVYAVSMYNKPSAYNFVSTSSDILINLGLMKAVVGLGLVSATASTSSIVATGLVVGAGYQAGKFVYAVADKYSDKAISKTVGSTYKLLDNNVKHYAGNDIATIFSEKSINEGAFAGLTAISNTVGYGYELLDNNVKHYVGYDIATIATKEFIYDTGVSGLTAIGKTAGYGYKLLGDNVKYYTGYDIATIINKQFAADLEQENKAAEEEAAQKVAEDSSTIVETKVSQEGDSTSLCENLPINGLCQDGYNLNLAGCCELA